LQGVRLGNFADVGSSGEGLLACAGEDDGTDGRVTSGSEEDALEVIEKGTVEGVQDLGAIEGDGRDGVAVFVEQILVSHGRRGPHQEDSQV
jgi:hypothetical protein